MVVSKVREPSFQKHWWWDPPNQPCYLREGLGLLHLEHMELNLKVRMVQNLCAVLSASKYKFLFVASWLASLAGAGLFCV